MRKLSFGSLFAGIGGFDLGFERAGMYCKWQVEINPFAQKVLKKHWPSVPLFGDVRDVGKQNLEPVDVVCGGFPCQDVSLAGKRKGLKGSRSTLWSEFARIICEIRPQWVVVENVPGLFTSDSGRFFSKILWELSKMGYDAEWGVIPASYFGAYHQRKRVFIVAYYASNDDGGSRQEGRTQVEFRDFFRGNRAKGKWIREPRLGRVADGVPTRVDKSRLKGLGNAVVPQVAEFIGKRIVEFERQTVNSICMEI